MQSPSPRWLRGHHDTRLGAAHRRRGAPCQDASASFCFRDRHGQGDLIQVLVVSDGHGSARHDRSEVGSRLACQVAIREVEASLRPIATAEGNPELVWRPWLAQQLPQRIVAAWRQEVSAHARAHPRHNPADTAIPGTAANGGVGSGDGSGDGDGVAATIPYGATLGLLVLTPRWWGYTGLGDWDLVRLEGDGQKAEQDDLRGELISEEAESTARGEATCSLCLDHAAQRFYSRSDLLPLDPDQAPFSLLLSTDGLRKSCSTDADFLTLAHYLVGLPATPQPPERSELGEALDHISSQGSGDDVSAAIVRWQPRRSGSGPSPSPRPMQEPHLVQPAAIPVPTAAEIRAQAGEAAHRLPHDASDRPSSRPPTGRGGRLVAPWLRSPWLLAVALGLGLGMVALVGGVVAWTVLVDRRATARRTERPLVLTDQERQALQAQAQRLCEPEPSRASTAAKPQAPEASTQAPASPTATAIPPDTKPDRQSTAPSDRSEPIRSTLNQRNVTFQRLIQRQISPDKLIREAPTDPLNALIAWSFRTHSPQPRQPTPPPTPLRKLMALLPIAAQNARAEPGSSDPAVKLCPDLQQALRDQWRGLMQSPAPAALSFPANQSDSSMHHPSQNQPVTGAGEAIQMPAPSALPSPSR